MSVIVRISILLALFLMVVLSTLVSLAAQETLTNGSIIDLVDLGMSEEIILVMMKTKPTQFDTEVADLSHLKDVGVSMLIIEAMVLRKQNNSVSEEVSTSQTVILQDRTQIHLVVTEALSSGTAKQNDSVKLKVDEDVLVGNTIVIPRGMIAIGRIVMAEKKGRWGKHGRLQFETEYVEVDDKTRVRIEAVVGDAEIKKSSAAFMMGLMGGLKKGKNIEVPVGFIVKALVDGDKEIRVLPSSTSDVL